MLQHTKALFISHGGGPLPLLGDPGHREMVACLQEIASSITQPEAIVVVSAHWEETNPTITSGPNPELIYDYYNFPPESYKIQYPCPGNPALAKDIYQLLLKSGIESRLDDARGFDHGLFVPLKIMYPEATIPCIQLSLVSSLDPTAHINIGRALQSLHQQNVLVMGSGFSFHNLQAFFGNHTESSKQLNAAFENWLMKTCTSRELNEQQRFEMLVNWHKAEGATFCHPREEHLLPLHVCYGVAQSPGINTYSLHILNRQSSMYAW